MVTSGRSNACERERGNLLGCWKCADSGRVVVHGYIHSKYPVKLYMKDLCPVCVVTPQLKKIREKNLSIVILRLDNSPAFSF